MNNNTDNKAQCAEPSTPGAGVEYSLPSEEQASQTSTFIQTAASQTSTINNPTILHHAQCQDDDGEDNEYENDGDNDDDDEGDNEEDDDDDEDEAPCHLFYNEETKELMYYCSDPEGYFYDRHAFYRRASLEEFHQHLRTRIICVCLHSEMSSCPVHSYRCAAQQGTMASSANIRVQMAMAIAQPVMEVEVAEAEVVASLAFLNNSSSFEVDSVDHDDDDDSG